MDELEKERLEDRTRVQTTQVIKTGFAIWLKVMLVLLGVVVAVLGGCSLMAYNAVQQMQQPYRR